MKIKKIKINQANFTTKLDNHLSVKQKNSEKVEKNCRKDFK